MLGNRILIDNVGVFPCGIHWSGCQGCKTCQGLYDVSAAEIVCFPRRSCMLFEMDGPKMSGKSMTLSLEVQKEHGGYCQGCQPQGGKVEGSACACLNPGEIINLWIIPGIPEIALLLQRLLKHLWSCLDVELLESPRHPLRNEYKPGMIELICIKSLLPSPSPLGEDYMSHITHSGLSSPGLPQEPFLNHGICGCLALFFFFFKYPLFDFC